MSDFPTVSPALLARQLPRPKFELDVSALEIGYSMYIEPIPADTKDIKRIRNACTAKNKNGERHYVVMVDRENNRVEIGRLK